MILKNFCKFTPKNTRNIFTSSIACANSEYVDSVTISNRDKYYKNMGKNSEEKPNRWDNAIPINEMPGPKPFPLVGNLWRFFLPFGDFYKMDLQQVAFRLRKQFGDIVCLQIMPFNGTKFVHLYNPKDIENLFRNEGPWPVRGGLESMAYYRNVTRKEVYKDLPSVSLSHGETWFKTRSVVNQILMIPRVVEQYAENMDEVAKDLVIKMKQLSLLNENGEMPENFEDQLQKWALESGAFITLDKRLGCFDVTTNDEIANFIKSIREIFRLLYELEGKLSFWKLFNTPNWNKYVKAIDNVFEFAAREINATAKNQNISNQSDGEMSILQRLLKADKNVALSFGMEIIIAGVDTTSRALAAALYFLAKNEDKQNKLRDEALKLLPNKNAIITGEMLQEAKYLKACIKESQRLVPIGIGHSRRAEKDMIIGGYQIPKGTFVITNNLYLSLKDEHFVNAKAFIPERWLRTTKGELSHKNTNPFIALPFGFGPRSCVGKRIALLQLEVAILRIVRNFKLTWPHEDMVFKIALLNGIAKPLKVRLQEIEN